MINYDTLHKTIKNGLYAIYECQYNNHKIIEEFMYEEGFFLLLDDDEIIGLVPVNSSSIYTKNESFKFFLLSEHNVIMINTIAKIISSQFKTNIKIDIYKDIHFMNEHKRHLYTVLTCDEQGGVHKLIMRKICTKKIIFELLKIQYIIFYFCDHMQHCTRYMYDKNMNELTMDDKLIIDYDSFRVYDELNSDDNKKDVIKFLCDDDKNDDKNIIEYDSSHMVDEYHY
jgi:hypothetical protein